MSFITIDKLNGSSGETISTITVPEYQGLEDRTQSFKVVVDGKEVFVNVQQKAFKPSLTTNKQVIPFTQEVLTQSLQITSNFNWEARTDSSWFTLSQTEGNKGTTTIEISTSSIDSPSENRNGTIIFYFGGKVISSLIIAQEFNIVFEVPERIDITYGAEIDITSNIEWSAVTYDTFYTFNPSSGSNGTTKIIFKPNVEESLSGIINFYGMDNLLKTVEVYITSKNVEEPSDVVDCFYIEPIEGITKISLVYINNSYGNVLYYENSEWKSLNLNNEITITRRTYFKDLYRTRFNSDKTFNIGGRLETLIPDLNHKWLFKDTKVVNAYNLRFPTEGRPAGGTGSNYNGENIYESMFENCKELIIAPKIIYVPELNKRYTCYNMFKNCSSLTNPPMLPSIQLSNGTYMYMFQNCSSLAIAPELPATKLYDSSYAYMFESCDSLTTAPELLATEVVEGSYAYMFRYSYNINYIKMLANKFTGNFTLEDWVQGVSPNGTFVKKKGVEIPIGYSGIPDGWTVVEVD